MKAFQFLVLLAIGPLLARADIAERWLERARQAQASFDTQAALEDYLKADQARPGDPLILQGIARQYSDLTMDTSDRAEQVRRTEAALAYAKRALAIAPDNAVVVLSVAICYGKLGLYSDIGTRIADAKLVKQYAERALALDPNYAYAHHVLGEWNTDVALLGRTKLWMIRLVYGTFPDASVRTGVREFQKAVSLCPACPSHWTGLGMAYLANGQREEARLALEHALSLPARERIDGEAQRLARQTLERLS